MAATLKNTSSPSYSLHFLPPHIHTYTHCRSETILTGMIIRPDSEDPNSTRMSMLIQNDMKGWVPHAVVNTLAGIYMYLQ